MFGVRTRCMNIFLSIDVSRIKSSIRRSIVQGTTYLDIFSINQQVNEIFLRYRDITDVEITITLNERERGEKQECATTIKGM